MALTLNSMLAMFIAMISLAIVPSTSVFVVAARSMTSGFYHGVLTALGILLGDFVFILIAIYSLSAIANTLDWLILFKYLGAAYLIWTGIRLCRTRSALSEVTDNKTSSLWSSFATGLFITLADIKAIFFYLSFFPAFLNLERVTITDTIAIMAIATVSVGGVKIGYAYLASRGKLLLKSFSTNKSINQAAGSLMVAIAIFLITTA